MTAGQAKWARRLRIESSIVWPAFGLLSAVYIGLFGHVLGVWWRRIPHARAGWTPRRP